MIFYMRLFFENLSRKYKFCYKQTKIAGNLHEDQYKFLTISYSLFLRMRNGSDAAVQKTETRFMFNKFLFSKTVPFMR